MRAIAALCAAVAAGLLLYVAVFALAVHSPLTIDETGRYIAFKHAALARTPGRRILILAGSNGRFSHSCVAITAASGIACVNLSTHAGLGLRYQIDRYIGAMRPGDLVYMPLEYRSFGPIDPAFVGDESAWLVAHDPARLPALYGIAGTPRALLQFDLANLIGASGEMALEALGIGRRFGVATLDAQGDEAGHDAARAAAFAAYRAGLPPLAVDPRAYADPRRWADVAAAIDRLRARGVTVVGGLPTVFDDSRGIDAAAAFLRPLFEAHGGCFVILPNRSTYPRAAFYDGYYHLAEPGQQAHSRRLAAALAPLFAARGCAPQAADARPVSAITGPAVPMITSASMP